MNEPNLTKSGGSRRLDELVNDRRNIPRRERMQIQLAFDRDRHRLVRYQCNRPRRWINTKDTKDTKEMPVGFTFVSFVSFVFDQRVA